MREREGEREGWGGVGKPGLLKDMCRRTSRDAVRTRRNASAAIRRAAWRRWRPGGLAGCDNGGPRERSGEQSWSGLGVPVLRRWAPEELSME